jgi:hypothetical protein
MKLLGMNNSLAVKIFSYTPSFSGVGLVPPKFAIHHVSTATF